MWHIPSTASIVSHGTFRHSASPVHRFSNSGYNHSMAKPKTPAQLDRETLLASSRDSADVATRPGVSLPSGPMFTRHKPFAALLLITGIVGFLASFILVLERIELYKNPDAALSCDVNAVVSCGSTMETWQAALFGFPNPLIGIVGFGIVITVAMSLFASATFARWYWLCFQLGVTLGFALVVWMWSQALFAINLLCLYCMVVWAMMIPMFMWTTIRNMVHGVISVPSGLVRLLSNWGWTVVLLLYIAAAASIFFRFIHLFVSSTA